MTTHLSASKARIPTDAFNRVVYQGDRIRVDHRSGEAVYIISKEDMALLEAIEDRLDVEAAKEALADMKAKGKKPIPWEKIKKKMAL
jgi:hypothetical protein